MTDETAASVAPLAATGLHKSFVGGDGRELEILRGVDFAIGVGEAVAITGESGAGKSTLLHLLGALDAPTRGEVRVAGRPVAGQAPGRQPASKTSKKALKPLEHQPF